MPSSKSKLKASRPKTSRPVPPLAHIITDPVIQRVLKFIASGRRDRPIIDLRRLRVTVGDITVWDQKVFYDLFRALEVAGYGTLVISAGRRGVPQRFILKKDVSRIELARKLLADTGVGLVPTPLFQENGPNTRPMSLKKLDPSEREINFEMAPIGRFHWSGPAKMSRENIKLLVEILEKALTK